MDQRSIVIAAMGDGRLLRPRDLATMGEGGAPIPRHVLHTLVREGAVVRVPEGFRLAGAGVSLEDLRWQEIALRHPSGVVCLEAAQVFHGLTDDFPGEIRVAVPRNASRRSPVPGVKLVSFSNPGMLVIGVEARVVSGNRFLVTDRHRTVADMFRPQNWQPADKADAAFRLVASEDGEDGIAKVSGYAHSLGWGREVTMAARTAKGFVRCAMPKP